MPIEGGEEVQNYVLTEGYTIFTGAVRKPRPTCKRLALIAFVATWILEFSPTDASASLLSSNLFPADNPWNQNISQAPVATNSAAIISKIGNGRFHPDFGQDYRVGNGLYGIPYNVVHGNTTPKIHVVIDAYASQSDIQNCPVPANAVIEGDMDNGPTVGLNVRGDSHMLVWDEDSNILYEFYRASRPSENADGQWHADSETIWDMKTNAFRTLGWTSGDAAGLPILPGLARPDEGLPVAQGGQGIIRHALRFTLPNAVILNQYLFPGSHTANPGNNSRSNQPPMGARFRLKSSVNISTMNPQAKVIAQAMKDYGLIVADNGSAFYLTGASYSPNASNNFALTWDDNDVQDTTHGLKSLWFTNFEVVDLSPAVTNLTPTQGGAGTSVTISGRNFSGAAGRLSVWFGTNQVSATATDDAHVTAIAPTGSGTVDVRVQSGIGNATSSANYTAPIWGNGLSPTSSVARFTFQSLDAFHSWLASYGLPSGGSADYLDSDGDGINNWQEYLAGTNPTNSGSAFKIISSQMISRTQFVVRWSSVSNRLYDVMRATNLAAGATGFVPLPGGTNLVGAPPANTWTDSVSRPSFYRVSVHQ
jgi:IPT/TIG domain.